MDESSVLLIVVRGSSQTKLKAFKTGQNSLRDLGVRIREIFSP